jgi:hypothetical protein
MSEHQPSVPPAFAPAPSVEARSWKAAYEKVVRESDTEKLLTLLHASEEALYSRWQEVGNDPERTKERAAMEAASKDLLAIKIHKLGWPDPCR